jgi:hypothetical protein
MDVEIVYNIVDKINSAFVYSEHYDNEGLEWDYESFKAIISRLQANIKNDKLKGKIYCYVAKNMNVSRKKNDEQTFSDAPEDGNTDRKIAKKIAEETACLILLRQNGRKEAGWRDAAFWWPVLITPKNSRPAVFASKQ